MWRHCRSFSYIYEVAHGDASGVMLRPAMVRQVIGRGERQKIGVSAVERMSVAVASLIVMAVAVTPVAQGEVKMSIWGPTAEGVAVPIYTLTERPDRSQSHGVWRASGERQGARSRGQDGGCHAGLRYARYLSDQAQSIHRSHCRPLRQPHRAGQVYDRRQDLPDSPQQRRQRPARRPQGLRHVCLAVEGSSGRRRVHAWSAPTATWDSPAL